MQVDWSQKLKSLDGKDLVDAQTSKPIVLRSLAVNALLMDERGVDGNEKVRRYDLATLIYNSKDEPIEIDLEDVASIKRLIGVAYGPLYVAQAWRMLEGKAL